jgi:hypothetical protein
LSEPRVDRHSNVTILRPAGDGPETPRAELARLREENGILRRRLRAARPLEPGATPTPEPAVRSPLATPPDPGPVRRRTTLLRSADRLPPILLEVEALRQRLELGRLEVERRLLHRERQRLLEELRLARDGTGAPATR